MASLELPRETFPSHLELSIVIEVTMDQPERSLVMEGIDLQAFKENLMYPERLNFGSGFDKSKHDQRIFEPPYIYNYFTGNLRIDRVWRYIHVFSLKNVYLNGSNAI